MVATAVYRFEPEITINEELMNTLTEEEKIAFVNASPAPVFKYNELTRRVEIDTPESYTVRPGLLPMCYMRCFHHMQLLTWYALISPSAILM